MIMISQSSGLLTKGHTSPGWCPFKGAGAPRSTGGGRHADALHDIVSLNPALWSQNLPDFYSFQIWKSVVTPWSRDTRQAEFGIWIPNTGVVLWIFGIKILVPLNYIFVDLTYWDISIFLCRYTYLHSKSFNKEG